MTDVSDTGAAAERRRTGQALALMIGATLLFPVGDTLSKVLTGVLPPLEVTFWRLVFQTAALGVTAIAMGRLRGAMRSGIVALGGLTTAAMVSCLILSFAVMPIATAIVIFFVGPLILTVFSALFLGETVGRRRYAAVLVGLMGAVVVIRPNWDSFGWQTLWPLGAATAFAATMVLVRRASARRAAVTIQVGMAAWGALALGAALAVATAAGGFGWGVGAAPGWVWLVFAAMGVIAGATFLMVGEAYERAPASLLAPTQYFEIVGATLLGWLVFGDLPDALTWAGSAIILGSGLYVFHRERQAG